MKYKQRFHSTFYDVDNNKIDVQIYKNVEDATEVTDEVLTLSADAISIKYVSDDIFQPLKQSGCTINILTNSILTDLYTGELNKVTVKVFKNDTLFWFGFLTPNIYSSEFESDLDLLQLEFVDVVSNLENVKFSKSENSISSFYDIITAALKRIDTGCTINKVYLHNSLTIDGGHDVLKNLYIQERNFYDESEEPQTYKEVIEDILRYLGMTLIQFQDRYYLIDYEALKSGNYSFTKFDLTEESSEIVTLEQDKRTLGTIGVSSANASISLGNIYNQVSIVANCNPADSVQPDLIDNDDLEAVSSVESKLYSSGKPNYKNYEVNHYISKSKGNWNIDGKCTFAENVRDYPTWSNLANVIEGTFYDNIFLYEKDKVPESPSYTSYLANSWNTANVAYKDFDKLIINNPEQPKVFIAKGGAFVINLSFVLSKMNYWYENLNQNIEDTELKTKCWFPTSLSYGGKWFDGSKWRTDQDWTFINTYIPDASVGSPTIDEVQDSGLMYNIYNSDKSICISVSESVYNSYTGYKDTTVPDSWEVEDEDYGTPNGHYHTEYEQMSCYTNGTTSYKVNEYTIERILLKNKFAIRTDFIKYPDLFNNTNSLENQVSWKQGYANPVQGNIIPLGDMTICGEIDLKISRPFLAQSLSNWMYYMNRNTDGIKAVYISDFVFKYLNENGLKDKNTGETIDSDILYKNVINSDNITELDDITMRVNTYSPVAASYSYVIKKDGSNYDFVDTLSKYGHTDSNKMEVFNIGKYVDHYSKPKFIYTNTLHNKNILPYSIISMKSLNKDMFVDSITYDMKNDSAEVNLKEV